MGVLVVFLTAWVVGFSGAMAPGPISTMVVNQAARRGFWVGPLVTLGHAIAELVIVAALVFGLQGLLGSSRFRLLVALPGGAFLVWMGVAALRDARRRQLAPPLSSGPQPRERPWGPVWAGLVTSFSNPYWFVWWSTVGASYVVLSPQHGMTGVAAFYSGHILSDLSWNSLLSFVMASGRRWLPAGVVRAFLYATGVFLVALGGYFVLSGIRLLVGS